MRKEDAMSFTTSAQAVSVQEARDVDNSVKCEQDWKFFCIGWSASFTLMVGSVAEQTLQSTLQRISSTDASEKRKLQDSFLTAQFTKHAAGPSFIQLKMSASFSWTNRGPPFPSNRPKACSPIAA